jgi:autotransporter-associated beta strand protein
MSCKEQVDKLIRRRGGLLSGLAIAILLVTVSVANATTFYWQYAGEDGWSGSSHRWGYSPPSFPAASDTAYVGYGGTCDLWDSRAVTTLYIGHASSYAGNGTVQLNYSGDGLAVSGTIALGNSSSYWGHLIQSVSSSLSADTEIIGVANSSSYITQGAGTNTVNSLQFGAAGGTYNLNGGTLVVGVGSITSSGGAANFNLGGGTLRAGADFSSSVPMALTAATTSTIDTQFGTVTLSGALSGGATAAVNKVGGGTLLLTGANTYAGDTTVGNGTLTISGSALLDINNSSLAFSKFLGTGALNLNGTLKFNVADVTDTSGSWQVVAASTLSENYGGAFAVELADGTAFTKSGDVWTHAAPASGTWTFTPSTGALTLTSTPTYLPGDANRDGTVNGSDLNTVLSNYNQTVAGDTWSYGDFNGDNAVNGTDLNTVLSNYNQSLGVGAAVPEPSTLLSAVAGLVGLLAYAWRKRK